VVKIPDSVTLSLDDAEVTLSPCTGTEEKTERRRAHAVLETTRFPPGMTATEVHLTLADLAPEWCSARLMMRGTAPSGYPVEAPLGVLLRDPVEGTLTFGPDESDPKLRKRFERVQRAIKLLGRDKGDGTATVTDDEIRKLELQGKLD
jgi:hypothetical protein